MFEIMMVIIMALTYGFITAVVVVALHRMFEIDKIPDEQLKDVFDLHVRA